ncbi:hypothetical protein ACMU_13645 [Actibacterium mucosum KCTC 23349]|uniref:Co-chaperone DjlA N-terminal domain-containing protein n=1 Tax=Actibacterium mucosum KCTC 23349 TaxID=1454373 RepID=A0A037ZGZ0_9RHOB|nr:hypothetical protein [Actibacterium mucosum]KAJ55725.1 hypothetical protein ACMU_13645 [Actibacterium mucosum KCTC 23349]
MHIILGLIAIAGAAYVWAVRIRNAADIAGELTDVASDVLSAARRFGFRRGRNQHPVDALEDSTVAIAGAGIAFLELGGLPSKEQHQALVIAVRKHLNLQAEDAEEAIVLGRWLMTQSDGPAPGFTRLVRRLRKLDALGGFEPLLQVLGDTGKACAPLSEEQREAIDEVSTVFGVR